MATSDALPADSLAALVAVGRVRRYPRGSLLFAEGDAATEVLVVREGSVKILLASLGGREVVLDVMEPGDLLGELSAIDAGERSATAIALTNVEVLAIPQAAFQHRLVGDPALTLYLLRTLAARMRGASRRQLEFGSSDALGRLCHRLLELIDRQDQAANAGATRTVTVPMSQHDLAAWAGLSREAVVKAIHTMKRLGWIETSGRQITVLELDAMTRRAND